MQRTMVAAAALVALAPVAALTTITTTGGPASAGPATSSDRAPGYSVIAKINKSEVIAGEDVVRVTGKVKPRAAGQTVILQQRVGSKLTWKKTGTAKTKGTGAYVLKDEPSASGPRQYRVVKPASNGLRAGISKNLDVTVYAWEPLGDRPTGAASDVAATGANIGAEYYFPSLVTQTTYQYPLPPVLHPTGYIEYTLAKKCIALKATYGLDDKSASGSTGSIAISTDGSARGTVNLAVGSIYPDQVLDVTDVFRIRFDFTQSVSPAAYPAVGQPMVLCTR
jgi:hypothetical protein